MGNRGRSNGLGSLDLGKRNWRCYQKANEDPGLQGYLHSEGGGGLQATA